MTVEPIVESTKIAPPCEFIFFPKLVYVFLKLQLVKLITEVLYGTRYNAPPSKATEFVKSQLVIEIFGARI